MVLAILHNRVMMRERERNRLKRLKNESTRHIVDNLVYDKHTSIDLHLFSFKTPILYENNL